MNDIVKKNKIEIEALINEINDKVTNLHHNKIRNSEREKLMLYCDNARSAIKDFYIGKVKRILIKEKYSLMPESSKNQSKNTENLKEIGKEVLLGYTDFSLNNKAKKEIENYRSVFRSYINRMILIEDKINNLYFLKNNNAGNEDIEIEKLHWRILPKGEVSFEKIFEYYRNLQRKKPNALYDEERLVSIKKLNPSKCYIGLQEFKGYRVFRFNYTKRAILENPYKGNAIYVLNGDWRSLSQMTKSELLDTNLAHVQRIVHNGDWFGKLQRALQE